VRGFLNASSSWQKRSIRLSHPLRTNNCFSLLFFLLNAHTHLEGLKAKALKRKEKDDVSPPGGIAQWKNTEAAGLLSWSIHQQDPSCSPLGRLLHWGN